MISSISNNSGMNLQGVSQENKTQNNIQGVNKQQGCASGGICNSCGMCGKTKAVNGENNTDTSSFATQLIQSLSTGATNTDTSDFATQLIQSLSTDATNTSFLMPEGSSANGSQAINGNSEVAKLSNNNAKDLMNQLMKMADIKLNSNPDLISDSASNIL
ncbi:MAG TPA: hypothetical protein VIK26_10625 [Clostridium sp.]